MLEGMGDADLDDVGVGLPEVELEALDIGPSGVVGLLTCGPDSEKTLRKIARRLGKDWWIALEWGEEPMSGGWARAREEGARAWPHMEPGRIKRADGSIAEGISPSGAPRGDRFILVNDARLESGDDSYGVIRELAKRLGALGDALDKPLVDEPRVQMKMVGRTDALLACFPGEGAEYRCHYDGGAGDARKLTAILYVNDWRPEHGGKLMMYDAGNFDPDSSGPPERCWRTVTPRAGRLVLFRSDRVLHKVAPAFAMRYALTMFYAARYGKDKRSATN